MPFEDSCIYAAIGLTSQGDCHALSQHMLGLLNALSFVERAAIFEVHPSPDPGGGSIFRRFTDHLDDERFAWHEPGLAESVARLMPLEVPDPEGGHTRLVFPVPSDAGPLRVICLDGGEISPQERVLLMHLVTLYRNQINVLDGKERDALTGLLNRQTFNLRLLQVIELRHRRGDGAWLAVLDIDHFKRINDTYGHLYGDEVLLHLAQLMQQNFRYTDFLFRFGGEEFLVLLSHASIPGARLAMERFRSAVENYQFPGGNQVTVSIGYTEITSGVLPTSLLDQADQALYLAKQTGRNQVRAYGDIQEPTHPRVGADVELF